MSKSTTIIFVPGAWHTPDAFSQVASILESKGYNTELISLASVGPKTHLKDFQPDVKLIRDAITRAADANQKVILVGHSYGGIPMTEAAHNLSYITRRSQGHEGGVTHLFYMCSFIIPADKSLIEAFGGNDLPWFNISEDRTEVNPDTPEKIFYNDMSEDEVKKWVGRLQPHSYQVFHSKVTHATWQEIPSTYLYCEQDNAIPLQVQELMVNEFGKGTQIRTDKVGAAHSPMLSMPKGTAEIEV